MSDFSLKGTSPLFGRINLSSRAVFPPRTAVSEFFCFVRFCFLLFQSRLETRRTARQSCPGRRCRIFCSVRSSGRRCAGTSLPSPLQGGGRHRNSRLPIQGVLSAFRLGAPLRVSEEFSGWKPAVRLLSAEELAFAFPSLRSLSL